MDTPDSLANSERSPLIAAMGLQLQALAARPIDARMLVELEKTCSLARQLLMISKDPEAGARGSMISGGGMYNIGGGGSYYSGVGGELLAAPAPFSPQETFGVTAIRELVALIPTLFPKPPPIPEPRMSYVDMLDAINLAKANGEVELEAQLRHVLADELGMLPAGMLPSDPALTPPPVISTESEEAL